MILRCLFLALLAPALRAAVVGTNPPALPLTAERIEKLPAGEQPAWRAYLAHSTGLRAADQKSLADEVARAGLKAPIVPRETHGFGPRILDRSENWYASAEARRMADNVITFQTPAGGWSKNFNPGDHPRQLGEAYAPDNNSRYLSPGDNDAPLDRHWNYVGTFDNDATLTELQFLARVVAQADEKTGAAWRASFRRGLEYIYQSQYPNGGWPQVYPLDGGYHDTITFNDDAFINIVGLLRDISESGRNVAWLTAAERARAAAAMDRALQCILACQIVVSGHRTAWCQQNDELTLAPASARNYEMPALSAGESSGIAEYLMSLPNPGPDVVAAVHGAAAWFRKAALYNVAFRPAPDGSGRALLNSPGAGPLWARYSEIGTNRPLFGDRDKTIHDRLDEISHERRNGYAWFGTGPRRALEEYDRWAKKHPAPTN